MTGELHIEDDSGIASTGDYANNTANNIQLPQGGLHAADEVACPAHVANLVAAARGGRFVLTSRLTVRWEEYAAPVPLGVLKPDQA